MAERAATGFVGGSGRSLDGDGGEERRFPSDASPHRLADQGTVGYWPCNCGQQYRVLAEPLTFWALSSYDGFRSTPSVNCDSCGVGLEDVFALEAARLVSASILR